MAGPWSSAAAAAASSRFSPPSRLSPLRRDPPGAGRVASGVSQRPAGFRGTQGRVPVVAQRQGRAGWEGEGAPFREGTGRERPGPDLGQHPPGQPSAPRESGCRRPRAHTPAQRPARPRSALRLPPAALPRRTHTLHLHTPQTHGHTRTPGGVRAGRRHPRGARARVHTLRSTHPGRQATAERPPPRHTAHPPFAPTASRVFNADAWELAGGGTRGRTTPRGAHAREVRAPPGRSPPAHHSLPGSPARAPHCLPRQPRTHCRPRCGCGCGCGPGSRAASPVPAGPRRRRRRRRRQGRSGRPPGLGPPSRRQKPPSFQA